MPPNRCERFLRPMTLVVESIRVKLILKPKAVANRSELPGNNVVSDIERYILYLEDKTATHSKTDGGVESRQRA